MHAWFNLLQNSFDNILMTDIWRIESANVVSLTECLHNDGAALCRRFQPVLDVDSRRRLRCGLKTSLIATLTTRYIWLPSLFSAVSTHACTVTGVIVTYTAFLVLPYSLSSPPHVQLLILLLPSIMFFPRHFFPLSLCGPEVHSWRSRAYAKRTSDRTNRNFRLDLFGCTARSRWSIIVMLWLAPCCASSPATATRPASWFCPIITSDLFAWDLATAATKCACPPVSYI